MNFEIPSQKIELICSKCRKKKNPKELFLKLDAAKYPNSDFYSGKPICHDCLNKPIEVK